MPPRLAEHLLAATLGDGEWSESILGDLFEEHASRAEVSPTLAAGWYCLQALRLSVTGIVTRVRRRRRTRDLPSMPSARPGDTLMQSLALEVRYAARSILKRPALSAIVVLTLALGLGANASIFSMFDALVLRPFTMKDVDRIALVSFTERDDVNRREALSPGNFLDLRKEDGAFERLAAFEFWTANLMGRDEPETVQGFVVTTDFFAVLGVQPSMGRMFLPEEETIGRHRRVVIGYGLWQRRFASDPSIVGQSIGVDGEQYEVVGIAPPEFDFPMGAQVWAPMTFEAEKAANRHSQYISAIGRLAPGKQLEDAKAQMAVAGERLVRDHPDVNRNREARVYTLGDGMMDIGLMPILALWQASAGFVLLIACANVASLLLARGAERQREMAIRLAIGASRGRVIRELLLESILLALIAVPAALVVAWASLKLVVGYMPAKIVRFVAGWNQMDVDWRLVGFTAALALLTAVVFGLVPALQASRSRMAETLKDGARGATAGASRLRLRRGLVVGEIALALPLLVAAALSVITVRQFLNGPQGFNPDGLLTMRLQLPDARYERPETRRQFADRVVEELAKIPGVQTAAAINVIPASDNNSGRSIEIDGKPNPDPSNPPAVDYRTATPGAFATLQMPIESGRSFTDQDRADTQPVAVINEAMARKYWPNEDPVGKRFRVGTEPWLTVVGICGNHIHGWFNRRNYPTMYRPFSQAPAQTMALAVRTAGDPTTLAAAAREAVRAVDSEQPVFDVQSMRRSLHDRTIGLQYIGGIMFVFGGLALLLAVVGVYGVMAFMVAQRTHEIGVRMALGATRSDVLRLTVRQAGALTVFGVGIGVVLSVLLGRLIEAALFGLASNDVRVTGGLSAILIASALLAGYLPARRAASIDPTVALRGE
jgi:putative ABC transport system permease protein